MVFSFNPNGVVVVESMHDIPQSLVLILEWTGIIGEQDFDKLPGFLKGPKMTSAITGFTPIGYIGWITTITAGSGEPEGYVAVKVEYYRAVSKPSSEPRLRGWLVLVQHSAKVYSATCGQPHCEGSEHYLAALTSETDWMTRMWTEQSLLDWGPKSTGEGVVLSFNVSWATAYASLSYSVEEGGSLSYEWFDMSDPQLGSAKVRYVVRALPGSNSSKVKGVLFTAGQASVGLLAPAKSGEELPLVVSHQLTTTLDTGVSATLRFATYIPQHIVALPNVSGKPLAPP